MFYDIVRTVCHPAFVWRRARSRDVLPLTSREAVMCGSAGIARIDAPSSAGMVAFPAGTFWMGSDAGGEAERPRHQVFLDAYHIGAAPVTNAQFTEFVAATGYQTTAEREPGATSRVAARRTWRSFATADRAEHPVVCVSWFDASAYAHWCGKRLPAEAEWERAAGGGAQMFPWGDDPPTGDVANWDPARAAGEMPPTTPVGAYPPNPLGLFDLTGSVWQWCADWYAEDYYSLDESGRNPRGPVNGQCRVRRGGAFNVREAFRLRCANRGAMLPHLSWPNLGFRCASSTGALGG